jgi:hypothetical protein
MRCRDAHLLSEEEAKVPKLSKFGRRRVVKDSMPWNAGKTYTIWEYGCYRHAIDCNLDIFYAKVDWHGKVNDNPLVNVNTECWLEFGPIKQEVTDGELRLQNYNDIDLNSSGPTFDDALVMLARKVKKHYGDFKV